MVVIFNYKWNSSDQRKQFPLPLAQFGLGSIFEQWEGLGRVSFECHFLLIFVCTLYIAPLWVPLHLNAAIPLKLYKEKTPPNKFATNEMGPLRWWTVVGGKYKILGLLVEPGATKIWILGDWDLKIIMTDEGIINSMIYGNAKEFMEMPMPIQFRIPIVANT